MALEEPPASTEAVSTTTPLVLAAAPAAVPLSADRPAGIVRPPTPLPLSVVVPPLADRTRNSANRFLLRSLASLAPPPPATRSPAGATTSGNAAAATVATSAASSAIGSCKWWKPPGTLKDNRRDEGGCFGPPPGGASPLAGNGGSADESTVPTSDTGSSTYRS